MKLNYPAFKRHNLNIKIVFDSNGIKKKHANTNPKKAGRALLIKVHFKKRQTTGVPGWLSQLSI